MASMVETVLGPIPATALGRTLTHEHLSLDFNQYYIPPPSIFKSLVEKTICLENIGLIRQYPYSSHENLTFSGEEVEAAVLYDVKQFKSAGGGTIAENTSHGLNRQIGLLQRISTETGVNIIAGCGYYVHNTQTKDTLGMSEETMYANMITEMTEGCIEFPSVKCGFIGEVGSAWPITDFEKRAIRASAQAQKQLNCAVTFHPGRDTQAPFEIMRIYLEAGGDPKRTIMSHLDRTFDKIDQFLEFGKIGCFCQMDLFGNECSWYQINSHIDMPSDAQRVDILRSMKAEGNLSQLLASHDIHTRHRLVKYGGHGYSHLLVNVVPKMLLKGLTSQDIDTIMIKNPCTWLTGNNP